MAKKRSLLSLVSVKTPRIIKKIKGFIGRGKKISRKYYQRITGHIENRPLLYFFILLGLLFILIIIGNLVRKPVPQPPQTVESRKVEIYQIGQSPKLSVDAVVEKSGVVQISALNGGIVARINVKEGQKINGGQWLFSLASNYQKGNALTIARQIAQKQNELIESTYPLTKELIGKQRDLANQQNTNFYDLRDITEKSISDTQNLINLNNDIIQTLDSNIASYEASGADPSLVLSSKQLKSQFSSANLQLNAALRNTRYQNDSDKSPTKLADMQKDMTLKQLEVQEKTLDLTKEISQLQVNLAKVNESLMFPSSPFSGTIQKIFVRVGQSINPGLPLALISGTGGKLTANIYLPKDIIEKISKLEKTEFNINGEREETLPSFISSEAVSGNLYQVTYVLPDKSYDLISDKSHILAQVPLGYPDTGSSIPFVPLDAIYQTPQEAYLFIIQDGKAVSKKVHLGSVFGRFVTVNSGLTKGDGVILDRNVMSGDKVTPL